MSATQPQIYPTPFDAVAARYDEAFTASKIGQAQRASVWRELERTFRLGDRVLEIGCGTAVDACFLAERGVRVIACDSSAQMIAVAARRIQERQLQKLVQPLLLRAENIAALPAPAKFDGAFSNFGALNCVEDLRQLAQDLAQLLRPGATALLCWMGACCLWETIWYLAGANPAKAFRRFRRGRVSARLAEGVSIRIQYFSVRTLARTFAPEFRLESLKGIGVTVPPSYLEPWIQHSPRLLDVAVRADTVLGRCPGIRALADHVLLRFRRLPSTQDGVA